MDSKPWWKSSTILINLVGVIVLGLTYVVDSGLTNDQDLVALILAIVNILNRLRSTISPLTLTEKK